MNIKIFNLCQKKYDNMVPPDIPACPECGEDIIYGDGWGLCLGDECEWESTDEFAEVPKWARRKKIEVTGE